MKLWQKKYELDKQIESYTVGNDYLIDQKLVKYDCISSIAHAKMLCKLNLISKQECKNIISVLKEIIKLDDKGNFKIKKEDEDCHTAIENYIVKKLGNAGKKIHMCRSRNDQIQTALRLFYKEKIDEIEKSSNELILALSEFKAKYGKIKLPGYTHMRKAMPSTIELWAEAFVESIKDDLFLIKAAYELIDQSPLGTGAGYGLPIDVDRKYTAKLLGFKKMQNNPIYVQNSRGKFESTILHALSQIMFDLNKISSDLILFSMDEFGYFELPKKFCTGSSIMPNKKNPDALEMIRANYHKINSYDFSIKNTIGNLVSGYNRDLQLTKEPAISGIHITISSLKIMIKIIEELSVNKSSCKKGLSEDLFATEKTYDLVKEGMAFRDAYQEIAKDY